MSGVAIIRALLIAAAPVTAIVSTNRIMTGVLPEGELMPAILINRVSRVPYLTVEMAQTTHLQTERIQVTPILKLTQANPAGEGYPGMNALFPLILAACANRRGTVAGFSLDSILPDIMGPDIDDEAAALLSSSQDFIVKWSG